MGAKPYSGWCIVADLAVSTLWSRTIAVRGCADTFCEEQVSDDEANNLTHVGKFATIVRVALSSKVEQRLRPCNISHRSIAAVSCQCSFAGLGTHWSISLRQPSSLAGRWQH